MQSTEEKKFPLSVGALVGLTLVGVLLLSAFIYYRAIKIQRFSEPALALMQPRIEFGRNIINLFSEQFQGRKLEGVRFTTDSIFIDESLLLIFAPIDKSTAPPILRELGKTFLFILQNPEVRSYIDLILINTRKPMVSGESFSKQERRDFQARAEFILHSLFMVEPKLERRYSSYFAATAVSVSGQEKNRPYSVEFRFIPTERLHIDVLKKLQKYTQ